MRGLKCVGLLVTTYIFVSYCPEINGTNATQAEVGEESARMHDDVIDFSNREFKESVKFINSSNLYTKISDVLIFYAKHFMIYDKMTMKTKSGKITVPLTDKIQRNLSIMVNHIMILEYASSALKDGSFDNTNPVDRFRFIRNNTVVMDQIVEHINASFRFHKDIENPEKLQVYNELKSDERSLKVGHLYKSMNDLVQKQKEAMPNFSDLVSGKLSGSKSSALNAEECLHLAEYVSVDNTSIAVQFYEAAVRRVDQYWALLRNKTQIVEKVIEFYGQQGSECENRIQKLNNKIEQIKLQREKDDDDDDDNDDEDDDDDDNNDNDDDDDGKNKDTKKDGEIGDSNAPTVDDKVVEPESDNSDEEKSDNNEDASKDDSITIDEHDIKCFRKIIKKSSRHDEL